MAKLKVQTESAEDRPRAEVFSNTVVKTIDFDRGAKYVIRRWAIRGIGLRECELPSWIEVPGPFVDIDRKLESRIARYRCDFEAGAELEQSALHADAELTNGQRRARKSSGRPDRKAYRSAMSSGIPPLLSLISNRSGVAVT
ncbi:MAG: hypothetical protein M5T61_18960 [Acidimicrobiia bacterium]|nr:hypothetical protein [Acidimicrobiia bacterium]